MKEITKQRLRGVVAAAIADGTTAGVNLLVLKDGRELFYDEQGFASREQGIPIRRDTIFRLFSMSKPITAAAVMILVERGQIDLGQQVSEFLPGFAGQKVERDGKLEDAVTPVTLLHLFNMTSGITYGDEESAAGRMVLGYLDACAGKLHTEDEVSTVDFADGLGRIPLAFEPDSSWHYGLSADVLGAVVERASGMRFGDFLKENLFGPLGMKDTDFWVPAEKQSRLAYAYGSTAGGEMELYTGENLLISSRMETRPRYEAGGAGLASTIDDYARFAQMLLNGGSLDGVQILSPRTVEFLTGGELTDAQQASYRHWVGLEGFSYSHLMRIMKNPGQAATLAREGEYGWDGWLGCYFANFPRERMTLLMMQQKKDAGTIAMTRRIRNVLLADELI